MAVKHTTFSIPHTETNYQSLRKLGLSSIRLTDAGFIIGKKYLIFKHVYSNYTHTELTEIVGGNVAQGPLLTLDDALAYLLLPTSEHKQHFIKSFK